MKSIYIFIITISIIIAVIFLTTFGFFSYILYRKYSYLFKIIRKMENQNFCFIMKDDYIIDPSLRNRVTIFNKINKEEVRLVINSCSVAVCTSYEETQHLSGIECAACNIPIVAREVGVYYDNKHDPRWGCIVNDDNSFVEQINFVFDNINEFLPREMKR